MKPIDPRTWDHLIGLLARQEDARLDLAIAVEATAIKFEVDKTVLVKVAKARRQDKILGLQASAQQTLELLDTPAEATDENR